MQENLIEHQVVGRFNLRSFLALAGIAGPLILIATDLIVAFSDPGYNFIRHSISSLAWARLGWIQTLGFLTIGLLTELFVAGLYFSIRGRRGFGFGIALLVCFGFGLLLIGAFHTDPATGPKTVEGTIHGLAAKFIFWLFPVAAFLIAPSLRKDPRWRQLFYYTIASGVFSIGFMINSIWMPPYFDWFGLFERILVAVEVIWVEVMAIWMLRLSLQSPQKLAEKGELIPSESHSQ